MEPSSGLSSRGVTNTANTVAPASRAGPSSPSQSAGSPRSVVRTVMRSGFGVTSRVRVGGWPEGGSFSVKSTSHGAPTQAWSEGCRAVTAGPSGRVVVEAGGGSSPGASTRNACTPPLGDVSAPGSRKPTPMASRSPAMAGPDAEMDGRACSQRTSPVARSNARRVWSIPLVKTTPPAAADAP